MTTEMMTTTTTVTPRNSTAVFAPLPQQSVHSPSSSERSVGRKNGLVRVRSCALQWLRWPANIRPAFFPWVAKKTKCMALPPGQTSWPFILADDWNIAFCWNIAIATQQHDNMENCTMFYLNWEYEHCTGHMGISTRLFCYGTVRSRSINISNVSWRLVETTPNRRNKSNISRCAPLALRKQLGYPTTSIISISQFRSLDESSGRSPASTSLLGPLQGIDPQFELNHLLRRNIRAAQGSYHFLLRAGCWGSANINE